MQFWFLVYFRIANKWKVVRLTMIRKTHVYIEDLTGGQESIPISFVNELDLDMPPQNWKYTSECVPGLGCKEDDFEAGFEGCSCQEQCAYGNGCLCVQRFGSSYSESGHIIESVIINNMPIIECGGLCSCTDDCGHRVAHNAIRFSLQVFKTDRKGFGLRTQVCIPRYSFVCEYAGEIIGKPEACCRVQAQKITDSNYIYVLQERGSSMLQTIIDPTVIGNVGRFINHSCDPDLIPVPVRSGNLVPKVCFFAGRDINAGEELTYDYSGNSFEDISNLNTKACSCGTSKCRGFLPSDKMLLCL